MKIYKQTEKWNFDRDDKQKNKQKKKTFNKQTNKIKKIKHSTP